MRTLFAAVGLAVLFASIAPSQQPSASGSSKPAADSDTTKLKQLLEAKVTAEWEAFKKKNKQAYSDLVADDFVAVEDDNEGMRKKSAAVAEVDHSVVNNYHLFAFTVLAIDSSAALVTYELTLQFPPKVQLGFKRVLVSGPSTA